MSSGKNKVVKEVYIVPHTHWDREWYLPFQAFRFKLVKLIDQLLENMKKLDYYFTLDGQSIVLEDYLEIRPEKKSELVELIRKGKIAIGPWYILPDEWLVGQESLLRNLEISFDLAREFDIPVMQVGYLPDQFGHTKAIPQILSNLTKFKAMVAWRGIGPEITSIPFIWKSHPEAKSMILGNYLPFGYGNAAGLPNDDSLTESIEKRIEELEPYTTIPNYLLMNGTDHHFPQFFILDWIANQKLKGLKIKLSLLEEYIDSLQKKISELNYSPPIYSGEFRSSARAPLLQDTYSARMWIKQWDAKIEDLLIHYAEPISSILFANSIKDYPTSELVLAWKWLLKNQPHDSICGCSIDQVHEEMKSRYYWAESIANTILEETKEIIEEKSQKDDGSYCAVFNPTNSKEILQEITFTVPAKTPILAVETLDGIECHTQVESASEDIVFDNNFKPMMLKAGLKMLPGRKLMDIYLNEVHLSDGEDPRLCEILLMFGKKQIGELDITALKADMVKIIESKKYNKFHVKATLGTKQTYSSMVPLNPWSLTKVKLKSKIKDTIISNFETTKNKVRTQFYEISFNNDGTFDLHDKKTNMIFPRLHQFESWGDRGDEYTFGRLGPIKTKLKRITRKVLSDGPNYSEIQQDSLLETFAEIDLTREKRIGKTLIPISTIFKFYRDIPRIDIKSTLSNTAKDHRLRICFDLPYTSEKTLTSTHFGFIERRGNPFDYKEFVEQPSGIQAQKRFIRINAEKLDVGFSLFNKGLPEVELVDNSRLALTLIRAIGYLSRQDFPERPLHAGPFLETPGAQELFKKYTFEYSILIHKKDEKMSYIMDHSEAFSLKPLTVTLEHATLDDKLLENLITINQSDVRISSLRIKDNCLLATIYNITEKDIETEIDSLPKFSLCNEVLLDGSIKKKYEINSKKIKLHFEPFEIKMLKLS